MVTNKMGSRMSLQFIIMALVSNSGRTAKDTGKPEKVSTSVPTMVQDVSVCLLVARNISFLPLRFLPSLERQAKCPCMLTLPTLAVSK